MTKSEWFPNNPKHYKTEMTPKERAKHNQETAQAFKNGGQEALDDIERHQTPYFHYTKEAPEA